MREKYFAKALEKSANLLNPDDKQALSGLGAGLTIGVTGSLVHHKVKEPKITDNFINHVVSKFNKKYPENKITIWPKLFTKHNDAHFKGTIRSIALGSKNKFAGTFFHEIGHGINSIGSSNKINTLRHHIADKGLKASLGVVPLYILANNITDDNRIKEGIAYTSALASLPQLYEEGSASIRGAKFAKSIGNSLSTKAKLKLLGAFGTYLSLATPSLYLAGRHIAKRIGGKDKTAAKKDFDYASWPDDMKVKGCSLGKDKNGYFAYTHRARSKSYKSPYKIPKSKIKFIESTG